MKLLSEDRILEGVVLALIGVLALIAVFSTVALIAHLSGCEWAQ